MIRRLLSKLAGCPLPDSPVLELKFKLVKVFDGYPIYEATANGKLIQREVWPREVRQLIDDLRSRYNLKVSYE